MKFILPRDRTISSTCGLSIEFKKGQLHLVPPMMYQEVIAAGGVPETELTDEELNPGTLAPADAAEREAAIFAAFTTIKLRGERTDFTAGNVPHTSVVSKETGWVVQAKERDAAWLKFTDDTK